MDRNDTAPPARELTIGEHFAGRGPLAIAASYLGQPVGPQLARLKAERRAVAWVSSKRPPAPPPPAPPARPVAVARQSDSRRAPQPPPAPPRAPLPKEPTLMASKSPASAYLERTRATLRAELGRAPTLDEVESRLSHRIAELEGRPHVEAQGTKLICHNRVDPMSTDQLVADFKRKYRGTLPR